MKKIALVSIVLTVLIITDYGLASLTDGLVSHWKFDEMDGTTAYDSAGNNNGTLIDGPTWTDGKHGGALSFDNFDDYVNVPHSDELNITDDITISAWVWDNGTVAGSIAIVSKTVDSGAFNSPYDFRIDNKDPAFTVGGPLAFVRSDASGHEYAYSAVAVSTIQWHHVLVTVENNELSFYIDGFIVANSEDYLSRPASTNTNPLYIGRRDGDLYFDGKIDDVRIYNRALNSSEAYELYTIPEPCSLLLIGCGCLFIRKNRK